MHTWSAEYVNMHGNIFHHINTCISSSEKILYRSAIYTALVG
jgi:hypothetical protein